MARFGLIVAGDYDAVVLREFLRRIRPDAEVLTRQCKDDGGVTRRFHGFLSEFEALHSGIPILKAIVARDAHNSGDEVRKGLEARRSAREFPFQVRIIVIVEALESWLLADHSALTQVARLAGSKQELDQLPHGPESVGDPKSTLTQRLSLAGVRYTSEVARRLAEFSRVDHVAALCPSFAAFKRAAECH